MVGAVDAQLYVVLAILGLSSLLNIYYLLEPLSRGFFRPKITDVTVDSHPLVVIPPVITALLSLALFFYADLFADLASMMVAP
jgi:multicomponent Na+:H+ antiporter subunit D